eukprot:gb/GECG01001373.1/.p1 GENE.gb/GECG01001373.1/~~gb/GECG01001373.1/.p1  ORF type:complete len:994 (+),score=184.31 gb/GECG01001373.1/:1-2982(+)
MSGGQFPNQQQPRFNPNIAPAVSGAMGDPRAGPRPHPRASNAPAPYVSHQMAASQGFPVYMANPPPYPGAVGGAPYQQGYPDQNVRPGMGGPTSGRPPQREMSDKAKEMREKLERKRKGKTGTTSEDTVSVSRSATSETTTSTVSSTSEDSSRWNATSEKTAPTADTTDDGPVATTPTEVSASVPETTRVSAFRSVKESEFNATTSEGDTTTDSIVQQQSAAVTSQQGSESMPSSTKGHMTVAPAESEEQPVSSGKNTFDEMESATDTDTVRKMDVDAYNGESDTASHPRSTTTAPPIGCPESPPIELVTNEHDGDDNKIQYTIATLRRLEPPKMQFNRPSLLLIDFELHEADVRESNRSGGGGGRGPRDRGQPSSSKKGGFGGDRGMSKGKGSSNSWARDGNKKRDPYEELGRAGKAFTKREKDTSEIGKAKKTVTDVCNKLSRDNFDKLSEELVKMQIPSFDVLNTVINLIFDKALEFQTFQDLFADLCRRLSKKADVWTNNFAQYKQDDQGWYYDLSGAKNDETKEPEWVGPYSSEEEAGKAAHTRSAFKRLLLNRCQEEFEREGAYETIENERKEMEKKLEEMRKTSPSGAPPADMVKEKEKKEEEWVAQELKIKRRMLANIGFIGHLYMSNLLTDLIVNHCINRLLYNKSGGTLDEENVEALLKLLLLVGKKYEKSTRANKQGKIVPMEDVMETVQQLGKDKRLPSRLRFRCLDVIEARDNGWKMPEHHVAAAAKTMSKKDFRKQAQEEDMKKNQEVEGLRSKYAHDSDYRKSSAKPRQDAKLSAQLGPSRHESRGNRSGGSGAVATGRPKVFGPRSGLMKRSKESESNQPAVQPAPQAQVEKKEEPPSMDTETRDKAKQRIHNSFKEYQELQDKDELRDSVKEIYQLAEGPPLFVVTAVEMLRTSRSAKDRRAVEEGLLVLAEEKYFAEKDVQSGIAQYLPDFSADLEDAPHLDSYIADVSICADRSPVAILSYCVVVGNEETCYLF